MSNLRRISIIYTMYGDKQGVLIQKQTPKSTLPITLYENKESTVIPSHIGDVWFSNSIITIVNNEEV